MPHIAWTRRALLDLSRLRNFLSPGSSAAAHRAIEAVREATNLIERHPKAGRPVENMSPDYRDWLVRFGAGGYVLRYQIENDQVTILWVKHMRESGPDNLGSGQP